MEGASFSLRFSVSIFGASNSIGARMNGRKGRAAEACNLGFRWVCNSRKSRQSPNYIATWLRRKKNCKIKNKRKNATFLATRGKQSPRKHSFSLSVVVPCCTLTSTRPRKKLKTRWELLCSQLFQKNLTVFTFIWIVAFEENVVKRRFFKSRFPCCNYVMPMLLTNIRDLLLISQI